MRLATSTLLIATCLCLAACGKRDAEDTTAAPAASGTDAETGPGKMPPPVPLPDIDAPTENPIAATLEGAFKADGSNPAWTAHTDGQTLMLQIPNADGQVGVAKSVKTERALYGAGVNYSGMDGDATVSLDLRHAPCHGGVSAQPRAFTATLTYGELVFRGCADAL